MHRERGYWCLSIPMRGHNPDWLRSLVAPLANDELGAASGYRWFIPERGGLASQLRSVWNASIASALGEREDKNFCWGGSTAIRRSTFDRLRCRRALARHGLRRLHVDSGVAGSEAADPLRPGLSGCCRSAIARAPELLEFTNRQLKITRVYAAHLWNPVLIGSLLVLRRVFWRFDPGHCPRDSASSLLRRRWLLLLVIYVLGAAKAYIRLQAVAIPLANVPQSNCLAGCHGMCCCWPIASALYLYNALAAAGSRAGSSGAALPTN